MYTLLRALGMPRTPGSTWEELDITQLPAKELLVRYHNVYVVLNNQFLEGNHTLMLTQVQNQLSLYSGTFPEWLVSLGNKSLPTQPGVPTLKNLYVESRDAWDSDYTVNVGNHRFAIDAGLTEEQQVDLVLQRPQVDFEYFQRRCLVAVNGLLHFVSASKEAAWVLGGAKCGKRPGENDVNIISFERLGDLKIYPIQLSMVRRPTPGLKCSETLYLELPESAEGYTPLVVFAGFLNGVDGTVRKLGGKGIALDLNRTPLIERMFVAKDLLGLDDWFPDTDRHSREYLLSDESIFRWLELTQSFVVLVPGSDLQLDTQFLESARVPGVYTSVVEPVGIFRTGVGQVESFMVRQSYGDYRVSTRPLRRGIPHTETRRTPALLEYGNVIGRTENRLVPGVLQQISRVTVEIKE